MKPHETVVRAQQVPEAEKDQDRSQKMKLMYVILYGQKLLYGVLNFFIEQGIEGATIIESCGIGQYISSMPIFASLMVFTREDRNNSKTIMTLIPEDKEQDII